MARRRTLRAAAAAAGSFALVLGAVASSPAAGPPGPGVDRAAEVAAYWTPERMAAATPRDLVVDERGLGYLRGRGGVLEPYGHTVAAAAQPLRALPADSPAPRRPPSGGSGDATGPTIGDMDPDGTTIPTEYEFSATVADDSGVKSVSFVLIYPSGATQSISAVQITGDTWGRTITGFTDGGWSWYVVAKDGASRGGNTSESGRVSFTVGEGSSSGGGSSGDGGTADSDVVTNAEWSEGGAVQTAAGRIYFEMPRNARQTGPWNAYVCSGTVVEDAPDEDSLVLTAAHCVYDDVNKAFARNVLFIPNQAGTTGSRTDTNCDNDPLGCWSPEYGVVDDDWTIRTFPDNIPWDYGYYVVPASAHSGRGNDVALESAVTPLTIDFNMPAMDEQATALGYSYSDDPDFMYCQEGLATEDAFGDLWLGSCGLSGGASGGPWLQPLDGGSGSIISVNSWGYANGDPGMGGPWLHETSAECLYKEAAGETAERGLVRTC